MTGCRAAMAGRRLCRVHRGKGGEGHEEGQKHRLLHGEALGIARSRDLELNVSSARGVSGSQTTDREDGVTDIPIL